MSVGTLKFINTYSSQCNTNNDNITNSTTNSNSSSGNKVPPVLKHFLPSETSDIQVKPHLAFIGTVILHVILRTFIGTVILHVILRTGC